MNPVEEAVAEAPEETVAEAPEEAPMEAPAEPQDLMDAAPATQETDFMDLGVAPAETEKTEDAFDYLDFGASAAQPASVSAPAEDPLAALAEPAEEKEEEPVTDLLGASGEPAENVDQSMEQPMDQPIEQSIEQPTDEAAQPVEPSIDDFFPQSTEPAEPVEQPTEPIEPTEPTEPDLLDDFTLSATEPAAESAAEARKPAVARPRR